MDIEQAYEAMINDIFWDGKAVGVCLSLPIITEINEVISELSEAERHVICLRYGLDDAKPLSVSLIAKTLGVEKTTIELTLAHACKLFASKLVYDYGFDTDIFMMSRPELLNAIYRAKSELRRAELEIEDLKKRLATETNRNESLKRAEAIKKAGAPYNIALADIGLKSHTLDCLRRRGWTCIYDIHDKSERDLLYIYRFGKSSLEDLKAHLMPYGIEVSR